MDNKGIDEYLLGNLNVFLGKSDGYLRCHFEKQKIINKSSWVELAYSMLGISSNKEQELIDNNIIVKTIRINKNGKIKESMSFPTIKFKKFVLENWKDSYIYEYFSNTKFLFIVYKETELDYKFLGGIFWKMPSSDLDNIVFEEWKTIKSIISNGVSFTVENGRVFNNLPNKSQTRIIHLRPKASKAAYKLNNGLNIGNIKKDGDELPNGEWMTTQCFWLNNDYVLEQIEEGLDFVKYTNSIQTLDSTKINLLKKYLNKDFYSIENLRILFRDALGMESEKYINIYNIKKLGYVLNANFVISDRFGNIQQYIGFLIMQDEIVDLKKVNQSILDINNYDEIINRIIKELPVYRIQNDVFIKETKLFSGGISKEMIHNFANEVAKIYKVNYFTINSLRKQSQLSAMFEYGLEDCFYEDIITSHNQFISFTVTGIKVFCEDLMKNDLSGFLQNILMQKKKIDVYDLSNLICAVYGIKVDMKKLKNTLRFSELYYNQDIEKVYLSREEFINEIKNA